MALKSVPGLVVVPGFLFEATTILALAAGAIFVMWLSEQITVRGLGNGALMVLMCGIISHLPFALFGTLESIKIGDLDARWLLFTPLMTAALMALVVVVERAVRRITIYDPSGEIGIRADDSRYAHITLKLNPTGVWVPIAASVLATPLAGIIANVGGQGTLWYRDFRVGRSGYLLLDALLIVLFAVLSGLAIFDPTRTARRLKDAGGFVPGFRPGENTARHLRATQIVLAVIGAVYLLVVCVLPELIYRRYYLPLAFGGLPTFLLAWFMVHILDQMRPYVRP